MQTQIQEFNQKLVEENQDIVIVDYVKVINEKHFNINISFIDDFIDMVDKDGFNISHEMLFKYEILTKSDSAQVARLLEIQNFEDGVDYSCINTVIDGSSKSKNIYMLSPDAFKIICMRSIKTKIFARYYLLLEKCVQYYNDYQLLKIQNKINDICKNRTFDLINPNKKERFIIVFRNEALINQYAVIRTQVKHVNSILRKIGYEESDIIINIPCCYANNLYNKIKEELKGNIIFEKKYLFIEDGVCLEWGYKPDDMINKHNHVSITRNIGLIDMSEEDFINKIYEIDKKRFEH